MSSKPFFSVVIPSYNRKVFLEKAVMSVLAQTFTDFELIIVDDGSTDGTEELISSIPDKRIVYIRHDNRGVAYSRNRGIEKARADIIAFLDSDDIWIENKLEKTREYINLFPDINIFHTEEIWFRRGEILGQKKKHSKPDGHVYRNALGICCIGMSTAVVKKRVFRRIGLFDETFEACEDYDLWLRASNVFDVKLIPEELTIKHGGRRDQLSVKVWGLDRFRIRSLEKMLGSGDLSEEDHSLTFDELRKKCEVFAKGCEKRSKTSEAQYYRSLPFSLS
jgi:glycosyltransferase involved in cell wall biosynthesis